MRHFEFHCSTISHTWSELFVGGRLEIGDLQLGDTFSKLICRSSLKPDAESFVVPVDLKVVRINLYRCDLNQVNQGCTAGLELTGDLNLRIGPHDVLVGESDVALMKCEKLADGVHMPLVPN